MADYPEWTDLRYFLELSRTKKLSETALRLDVESSTVSRRVDRLERHLGTSLFDRSRRGYVLTEAGRALLPHAEAMESDLFAAMAEAAPSIGSVAGKIRVGCPEVFAAYVLTPRLHQLCELHPGLNIELIAEQRFPSIVTREVDILISASPPKSGRYIVARLYDLNYCLYGAKKYLDNRKPINEFKDLAGHVFVDYVQDRLVSEDVRMRYIEQFAENPHRVFTATSFFCQIEAVTSGIGLGLMPPYVVRRCDGLVRIFPDKSLVCLPTWITAPEDLYRLRRIRVVWDFIRTIVDSEPELFAFPD